MISTMNQFHLNQDFLLGSWLHHFASVRFLFLTTWTSFFPKLPTLTVALSPYRLIYLQPFFSFIHFCQVIVPFLSLVKARSGDCSLVFKQLLFAADFLDAFSHLYKRVCLSVRPSVRRSVRPSVTLELNF